MKKIIFLVLFAIVSWNDVTAQNFIYNGLKYNIISSTTAEVTDQTGISTGNVLIPSEVFYNNNSYLVKQISLNAFRSCTNLVSITIPNSITSIGNLAFDDCTSLSSVSIPSSVTNIGNNAFRNCFGLTSVTIPNSVTSLKNATFRGCNNLTSITIPSSVTFIGFEVFRDCTSLTTIICNNTNPVSINATTFEGVNQGACNLIVPNSSAATAYQAAAVWQNFNPINCSITTENTTTISACGSYNWANNNQTYTTSGTYTGNTTNCVTEMLNLTITPSTTNTTTISACNSYTWANNGQSYSASGTYSGTTTNCITEVLNLTITTPPTNFTSGGINYVVTSPTTVAVGSNVGASGNIVIPAMVTTDCGVYSVTSINEYAFSNNTAFTTITIPDSVISISDFAFYGCSNLTSITFGNSLASIGLRVFEGSSSLTSITFPNSVSSIGNRAFANCTGLTSVTFGNSITNIGSEAFFGCSVLTSVTIPNSLTSISYGTFFNCSGLTSVIIGNSVTSIGESAFNNCNSLTSVTIPNSVTSIEAYSFLSCTSLTSLNLGNLVTTIGDFAFDNCSALTSVTIPNSVTSIGGRAFSGCTSLTSLTIGNSVSIIGSRAFGFSNSLTSVRCDIITPLSINSEVFLGLNQSACSLTVANVSAYQAAAVWQNFSPINCSIITENTTTISACNSYTWANNSQTYTTSGTYTGLTTNCVTEILNLTITTPPTNFTSGGINYVVTSDNTVAVGYNSGASGSIVIPATVTTNCGTYSVTSIGNDAFGGSSELTSITIPDTVTSIGNSAFVHCTNLNSITIPNSVSFIGMTAFAYCTSLTSVTIPNSIYRLNNGLFRRCNQLTTVTIPSSVNEIGYEVFRDCTSLTTLICNNTNPVSVNETTFEGVNQGACNLIVPNASAAAAYRIAPFWQYFAPITCLNITENTTTISACNSYTWAHNNQTYTTSGTYTGTTTNCVTEVLNLTITTPPTNFTSGGINYVVTSDNTVAVGLNPTANGSIIIPATVTNNCGTYSVTSISISAFQSCSGLTQVTIPESITMIGALAFRDCSSLTSVIIPNSVITINPGAFYGCTGLTSATISNSLTSIKSQLFYNCSGLTSLIIPSSVTTISNGAFFNCIGLTSVIIPSSVSSIGNGAFRGCNNLTSVTIPSSVANMGIDVFYDCTSLTSVICKITTPLVINANVFQNVNQSACSLTVPDASVAAYQAAAIWQYFAPIYCVNQTVNTTTISVCDTYTWANNGQTYSVSGTYRGTTSNCITEMLNLTITPSTTNTTTISACDSYNWTVNGQTYTSGGTYTSVSGCHTDTLVLTIMPSSDTTTEITSCGSYTWSNNGQTYSASGIYRGITTNCVTEVLNLTINALPSAPSLSIVDQHCDNITGYLGLKNQTQTFKAGAPGRLDKISIYLGNPNGNASESLLTVQVYEGLGTNGTLLGFKEYAYPAQWGFQNIDFIFTDISVVQDQQYTFKLSTPSVSQGFVGINTENTYTDGSLDFAPSSDMIFKTYVVRANQTFCQGATVSNLESDGANIIWYDAATGGNQINSNELLATGSYFVAQNDDNSCQSQRTSVNVLVNPTTAITLQPVAGLICSALGSTTTFSVTSNAVNPSYTWQYKVAATTANANPDWITITSANAAVYANFNTPTLTVTKTSQLPKSGTQYRVLVTGTCGNATSNVAPLTVLSTVKAGSISTSASSVCIGSDITLTVAGYAGTSFQWQSSPISTSTAPGVFTDIEGATGTTYIVAGVTNATDKSYRVIVTNSCDNTTAISVTKTIVVNPTSVAGTVTGGGNICSGGSGTLKVAGHIGSIQWEYSTNGNDYVNAPKAADAQTVPFGTTSSNSTSATYLVTGISTNLYFRAKITSGACSSVYTIPVKYTITTVEVGTISAASNLICSGTGTSLTLTNATGAVTWQKSTNLTTPSWSAIANATGLSIETGNLTSSTAYRAMVTLGGCSAIYSEVIIVSIIAAPSTKTISANTTTPTGTTTSKAICREDISVTKTLTVGYGYVGTIQWQKSTTPTTTDFVDIIGQTGTSYTVENPVVGANYFRAKFTNSCGASVYGTAYTLYYKNCYVSRIIEKSDKEIAEFKVIASPNPYSENFNLNITTSRVENVEVSIYDMTGKLIDKHEVRPNDATTLEFGTNYPTGVYNVMVTQGIETKTLRVIKK